MLVLLMALGQPDPDLPPQQHQPSLPVCGAGGTWGETTFRKIQRGSTSLQQSPNEAPNVTPGTARKRVSPQPQGQDQSPSHCGKGKDLERKFGDPRRRPARKHDHQPTIKQRHQLTTWVQLRDKHRQALRGILLP